MDYKFKGTNPEKWRSWENDDDSEYRRYMWPKALGWSKFYSPASYELSDLFNMPFTKRGGTYTGHARGHLRFIRRKFFKCCETFHSKYEELLMHFITTIHRYVVDTLNKLHYLFYLF